MQIFLVLSIVIAAITIGALVLKYRSSLDFSISLNAARHPLSLLWLGVGTGASLLLVGIWYFNWFLPSYGVSLAASVIFISIITSLLVAIAVPDIQGAMRAIHRTAAYAAVLLMPIFLIAIFTQIDDITKVIASGVIIAQCVMIYLLFFVKSALKYLLQFQVIYLSSFLIVLIILTYA